MGPTPPPPPVDVRLGSAFDHSVGPQTRAASALGVLSADAGMARAMELDATVRESSEAGRDPTDRILTIKEWGQLNYPDLAKESQIPFFVAQQLQEGYDRYLKRQQLLLEMRMAPQEGTTARMNALANLSRATAPAPPASNIWEFLDKTGQTGRANRLAEATIEETARPPQPTIASLFAEIPGLFEQTKYSEIARNLRDPKKAETTLEALDALGLKEPYLERLAYGSTKESARPNMPGGISKEIQSNTMMVRSAQEAKQKNRFEETINAWSKAMEHLSAQDSRHHPEMYASYERTGTRPTIPSVTKLWETAPPDPWWWQAGKRGELLNKAEFVLRTLLATDPRYEGDEEKRAVHTAAVENWLRKTRASVE